MIDSSLEQLHKNSILSLKIFISQLITKVWSTSF